jgi:hypothetical protein
MALNELSRAVALKALGADVAARLRLGEKPEVIRAALLAEGYPPEVIDHVFSECESSRPIGRRRTVIAAVLSAILLLGLPLAGGFGAAWVASNAWGDYVENRSTPAADVPPEVADQRQEAAHLDENKLRSGGGLAEGFSVVLITILVGPGAFIVGFGLGLALALPAVRALSAWSIDGSTTDDEAYD